MKAICLALLSAVAAASALTGCYKVKNDAFCCTTQESCAAHGATFPDDCEGNFVCDSASLTCVDPGNGGKCMGAEQCVGTPVTPYCVDGTCKQCMGTVGCNAKDPVCGADNICGTCTQDADCDPYKPGTPHCGGTGACVQCNVSKDCTAATKPICDTTTNTCGGCTSDDQCDSKTCDKNTGECIAESRILYLAETGVPNTTCSRTMPCKTFADAIALLGTGHDVIKAMPGMYAGAIVLDGKKVSIYGEGATAVAPPMTASTVAITNGANVTIDGLHITGATGTNHYGVECVVGSSTPTVRLLRTLVDLNINGGVSITGCDYELVNNMIVQNGGVTSVFGGLSLVSINTGTTHVFEFNTVAGNGGKAGKNTGVDCSLVGATLQFDSSIVYANQASSGGKQVAGDGCNWSYSDISDSVQGTNNTTADPMFVDGGNGNYHLMPGSPAIDAANPLSPLGIDYDGDARPAGKGRDMGADEAK